jgi:dTDP-glucose 4,6-dehydratase
MRIVITGAAGFLGSHLSRYFINKGHSVIGIDNFITGNIDNVSDLFKTKKFEFIEYNVVNYIHVPGKVDAVLHFASPASPIDYLKFPIPTLKVGALGTYRALGFAKAKKAKFMIASTSEVYGDPLINPQVETYWGNVNPIGPRGVYDEAKRYAEALTMAYHRYHKMPVSLLRIFNTYGPNMRLKDGRAVPNFMVQALKNKPITVYGKGEQTRSLCYVSDLVRGIYKLLQTNINTPVNIGNPHEVSILELAQTIKKLTKSKSRIIFKKLPQDDPKVRKPDITIAKAKLKWQPKISLEEGLKETVKYFKAAL